MREVDGQPGRADAQPILNAEQPKTIADQEPEMALREQRAAEDEAVVLDFRTPTSRPSPDWFCFLGVEIPLGIDVHPQTHKAVVNELWSERFITYRERGDGHFRVAFGIDGASSDEAYETAMHVANDIKHRVGGVAISEFEVLRNEALSAEVEGGEVIPLEVGTP